MSHSRRSTRLVALAALVAAALALLAPSAQAGPAGATPGEVCTAFPHRQTYVGTSGLFRAPAWHYDKTVTIVYEADSCGAQVTDFGNYVLTVAGTATVHQGSTQDGKRIDERPFTSVLRTSAKNDSLGWPVAWWSCFQGSFNYVWSISDVYSFSVSAQDGRWVMAQSDPRSGDSTAISTRGCRSGSAS